MKKLISLIPILFLMCCSRENKDPEKNKIEIVAESESSRLTLLEHVTLAINPNFQNWVLFENGTYIIFDNVDTLSSIEQEAVKLMKEYGPVHSSNPAGDFGVTHLIETDGWVVSGHCYGMYTYVHPTELNSTKPDDLKIGLFGRSKREKDGKNPQIIYVNREK